MEAAAVLVCIFSILVIVGEIGFRIGSFFRGKIGEEAKSHARASAPRADSCKVYEYAETERHYKKSVTIAVKQPLFRLGLAHKKPRLFPGGVEFS